MKTSDSYSTTDCCRNCRFLTELLDIEGAVEARFCGNGVDQRPIYPDYDHCYGGVFLVSTAIEMAPEVEPYGQVWNHLTEVWNKFIEENGVTPDGICDKHWRKE